MNMLIAMGPKYSHKNNNKVKPALTPKSPLDFWVGAIYCTNKTCHTRSVGVKGHHKII